MVQALYEVVEFLVAVFEPFSNARNHKGTLVTRLAGIVLALGSFALAGQDSPPTGGPWSGVIINSTCSSDEAFAEAATCTETGVPGARLALYDDTTRHIYSLDPQDHAIGHLGDSVTVNGTVQGTTLHVSSLKVLTAIGLHVVQKAPAFSARDQFGQEQSLKTLKGPRGTVLLFFRSADW